MVATLQASLKIARDCGIDRNQRRLEAAGLALKNLPTSNSNHITDSAVTVHRHDRQLVLVSDHLSTPDLASPDELGLRSMLIRKRNETQINNSFTVLRR